MSNELKPKTKDFTLKAEGYIISNGRLEGNIIHLDVQPRWIKIKDEFPVEDGKYLVYDGRHIRFESFKDGYFIFSDFPEVFYDNNQLPFTHWMPSPQPPQIV